MAASRPDPGGSLSTGAISKKIAPTPLNAAPKDKYQSRATAPPWWRSGCREQELLICREVHNLREEVITVSYGYIKDTAQQIEAGWFPLSGTSFGGVNYGDHQAAIAAVTQHEEAILSGEAGLAGLRAQRDDLLVALGNINRRFYYGVLCHPEYGEDSPFLNQCGYVRRSDRASGLTTAPSASAS
jgi:hypothetical protein